MFFDLRDRRQATLLISTHVMDEAARCERLTRRTSPAL
jgi:ABC-type multidrug transport system ATPase subunit